MFAITKVETIVIFIVLQKFLFSRQFVRPGSAQLMFVITREKVIIAVFCNILCLLTVCQA